MGVFWLLAVLLIFGGVAGAAVVKNGKRIDSFDYLIANEARMRKIDPALIKAIIQKESSGDPDAINPEKSGVAPVALRVAIQHDPTGGDSVLRQVGVDPSIGLMQVRVSTAKQIQKNLKPVDMFQPGVSIALGTAHVAGLFKQGFTADTIDAYNMGAGNMAKGKRNLAYRDYVLRYYEQYKKDFGA